MKSYFDIAGDGGSDIAGQVAAQRARIARNLEGIRHSVAIGSGKGGVGKSTLTTHIALALRATGREVAVLDADLNGPTQARLSGLRDVTLVPGAGGMAVPRGASGVGVVSLGSFVPESDAVDFESVSSGESHVWRAAREFALLADLLEKVDWGRRDYLLIDLPPGAERTLQYAEFLGEGVAFVLVTVPSDLSRGVVARSVAALRKTPNRLLGYVENMKGYYCECCDGIKPLFPEAGAVDLGVRCLGAVPFDPALARVCDRGEPMKLASTAPPDRGSLSVVYACPKCSHRIAMLTNPYETQLVSSLGVRIGPAGPGEAASGDLSKCPFGEMVQEMRAEGSPEAVPWTAGARHRLDRVPEFVRPMARVGIEKFAKDNGFARVDEEVLDKAKDFFGM